MRKEEFLQTLRRELSGDVPPAVVEENVRYYMEYINGEIRSGREEEEVIAEIGDPRLIAKNIEDTTDGAGNGAYGQEYGGDSYTEQDYSDPGRGFDSPYPEKRPFHLFDLSQWYGRLMVFLVVVLVLYVIIMIVGGLFSLLAPLIGPILVIWLIIAIVNSIKRR